MPANGKEGSCLKTWDTEDRNLSAASSALGTEFDRGWRGFFCLTQDAKGENLTAENAEITKKCLVL